MLTVDFNSKEETFQRGNLKSWNLCARLTLYCTIVYSSFQPKSASVALFKLKSTWDDKFFSSYLKRPKEKAAFDEPLSLSGHYRLIVALGRSIDR